MLAKTILFGWVKRVIPCSSTHLDHTWTQGSIDNYAAQASSAIIKNAYDASIVQIPLGGINRMYMDGLTTHHFGRFAMASMINLRM
jgi:hypothetical protein